MAISFRPSCIYICLHACFFAGVLAWSSAVGFCWVLTAEVLCRMCGIVRAVLEPGGLKLDGASALFRTDLGQCSYRGLEPVRGLRTGPASESIRAY